MEKRNAAGQVLLLTGAGLVVKVAGLFFKLPLTTLIGEEGMGCFNTAYTIFVWFYTLSTSGLPAAEAMLISKETNEKKRVLHISLFIFTILGLLGTTLMAFGAGTFSKLLRAEKAAEAIFAISPVLFFVCLSAGFRGYFQGIGELRPHAFSQVAEAFGKLFFGVAIAWMIIRRGGTVENAAAGAALGICGGMILGLILLVSWFFVHYLHEQNVQKKANNLPQERNFKDEPALRRNLQSKTDIAPQKLYNKEEKTSNRQNAQTNRSESDNHTKKHSRNFVEITKKLISSAIPITLSASVMSLTSILDTIVMTRRLNDAGFSQAETIAIYGNYSSLAVPMFNLPPVLIYPIAYALMPALSSLYKTTKISGSDLKKARGLCGEAFRATCFVAIPCVIGMCAMAEPILSLLFREDMARRGALMLSLLAPSSFFVCLLSLTGTILQSTGHERVPLAAMLAGAAVKLASSWLLIPCMGKYGTPVSTFLCYLTICTIEIAAIARLTDLFRSGKSPEKPVKSAFLAKDFVKPLVVSTASVFTGCAVLKAMPDGRISTLISVILTIIVYFAISYKDMVLIYRKQAKNKEVPINEQAKN